MIEFREIIQQAFTWLGPPLLWVFLLKIFPDFVGGNLIKALEAKRSAELERIKGEIARRNALEIEALKADLQTAASNVKTSADFLIAGQGELRSKTIAASELLWSEILRIREVYSSLVFANSMLTKDEISDFVSGKTKDNGYFPFEEFRNQHQFSSKLQGGKELDQARLFVGDRLWLIFFNYRAILGRCGYLMGESLKKRELRYWQDDPHIRNMVAISVQNDAITKNLFDMQISGLEHSLAYVSAAFLKEAARVMSGSSSFADSLSDVQATLLVAEENASSRRSSGGAQQ